MIDGNRRRERPDHRRHLRRPDSARVDDLLRFDPACVRPHSLHLAARSELDTGHARSRPNADSELAAGVGDGVRRDMRIDVAVTGHPDRAVERFRARRGQQTDGFFGRDELGVEPDAPCPADAPPQLEEAVLARRHAEAADRLENVEAAIELDAVAAEAHHRRRGIELRHEPGSVVRGAARQLPLVEQQHVGHAFAGEVVRGADAGDPAADDDDLGPVVRHARVSADAHATMRVRSPRKRSRANSTASPVAA